MSSSRDAHPVSTDETASPLREADSSNAALSEALLFEQLAAELSTGFINLPSALIDRFIDEALRQIVETLGIDRATLAEFSRDVGSVHFTHSWAVDGVQTIGRFVSTDQVPWARRRNEAALPVVFDRLEELPPEASTDRSFWQGTGVRSLIIWPMHVGGDLTGSLSLVCVRQERSWSRADLDHARSLANIFGNAVARKHAMEDVERALRFERLVADISASLFRAPPRDPDEAVGRVLQAIGESLHVERVALWRLTRGPDRLELEYGWGAERTQALPRHLGRDELPWMLDALLFGETVSFSGSDQLPPQALVDQRSLDRLGARSLLFVPVMVEGVIAGGLSLASVSVVRSWPEPLLPRVRLLGELLASMVARSRASQRLHDALQEAGQYRERLAHLERVHTVGEMSASIAHEINQPLIAIENYALAARRRLAAGGAADIHKADELLDKIALQAARAGDVLGRLRSMLKKHEPEASEIDLGQLVSDVIKLVEIGPQRHDLRVEVAIAPDLPRVIADGIQIQQVVLNLARNGVEAMAAARVADPRLVLAVERSSQSDLVVRVSDNGPGVAPDHAERIFEPFYSTKQTGLGIGLAICRAIVAAHGGALSCLPGANGGAMFQFTLPIAGLED